MKRIISLVLILTLLCTVPIYAAANGSSGGQTPGANATSTDKQSQNVGGTWNNQHQGMRIYAIDKSGRLVSNVIDVVKDKCYTEYVKAVKKGFLSDSKTTKTGETPTQDKYKIRSESDANDLFFNKACKLYKDYANEYEVSGITNVAITGGDTLEWDEYEINEGQPLDITNAIKKHHTVKKSSASIPQNLIWNNGSYQTNGLAVKEHFLTANSDRLGISPNIMNYSYSKM